MNPKLCVGKLILLIVLPLFLAAAETDLDVARELLTPTDVQMEGFFDWRQQRRSELAAGARSVQTSVGRIQYKKRGHGPVVICLHGGFGGYDQAWLMGSFLMGQGFTVVAPSRPGYLGTPLSVGATVEQQADATVALMDALGIKKAAIYGFSAGSLVAFQVGVRHPSRTSCVILTGVGLPRSQAAGYTLLDLFLKANVGIDILPYGLYLLTQADLPAVLGIFMAVDSKLKGPRYNERVDHVLNNPYQHAWARDMSISLTPFSDRRLGLIADAEAVATWSAYEAAGQFASFQPPALFIDSRLDNNGSYPQTRRIAKKIATARLITVQDSGHFVWLGVNTAKWQGQMVQYLKKHRH
jgi:pimeloyl-ACP methyl ester carboxylesterase